MKRVKFISFFQLTFYFLFIYSSLNAQVFQLQDYRSGLSLAYYGNGVAAADYNNDGFIDIYFVSTDPTNPNRPGSANSLFKNNGDGTFENVAKFAGVEGMIDTSTNPQTRMVQNYGASWGDFDNDGDVDLFLTNKGVDELYENLGDGTFKNISHSAGIDSIIRDSSSSVWFDLDRDGDLDLYVSSYGEYGEIISSDNIMYRNNGDGTFTDITAETGLRESGYTFVTMVWDVNDDGWPDLYCVNDFGANYFYLNNGDGSFREATREFGLENEGHGMGVTLGDYDNNGRFDLYLTNITTTYADPTSEEWNPLFSQFSYGGVFQDVSFQAGTGFADWGWGCEFFDYDLDGDLDLYVVNGFGADDMYNRFFRNNGNKTFEDFSNLTGTNSDAEARGLCVADFNNDGRLDVFVANVSQLANYYLNNWQMGNYLKINLVGTRSNRDARGAVAIIEINGRSYCRPNDGVEFYGQSKVPIHFGLGDAEMIEKVIIQWPLGSQQEFTNIPANQTITIKEDVGIIVGVKSEKNIQPTEISLLNNYPNPVQNRTLLHFQITMSADVKIEIFDLTGRLVSVPIEGFFQKGDHLASWEAIDMNGQALPSGIYFQKLTSGTTTVQQKIMVVR